MRVGPVPAGRYANGGGWWRGGTGIDFEGEREAGVMSTGAASAASGGAFPKDWRNTPSMPSLARPGGQAGDKLWEGRAKVLTSGIGKSNVGLGYGCA